MIIGTCFKGDDNESLKMHQHEWYNDRLIEWLHHVDDVIEEHRDKQQLADLVKLWDDNDLGNKPLDHRCLQEAHDAIATSFRFCAKHEIVETERVYTKSYWRKYFKKIVTECMQEEYAIKAFITVLACTNTEEGYEAEELLTSALQTVCDKYEPGTSQMALFSE